MNCEEKLAKIEKIIYEDWTDEWIVCEIRKLVEEK
jgi:hypothetical protein